MSCVLDKSCSFLPWHGSFEDLFPYGSSEVKHCTGDVSHREKWYWALHEVLSNRSLPALWSVASLCNDTLRWCDYITLTPFSFSGFNIQSLCRSANVGLANRGSLQTISHQLCSLASSQWLQSYWGVGIRWPTKPIFGWLLNQYVVGHKTMCFEFFHPFWIYQLAFLVFYFFAVLGLELRAYTLSHSTSPFLWRFFLR
jgi:hypothetical protein